MAYTINLTNGTLFATIPDGTINTTSSMTLIGKNYAGYGQFLDDNFIHLLESGANSTPPSAPLTGQLWFNTTSNVLNVYNGTSFKPIGGAAAAASAPTNNTVGDLWFDTVNAQLNVWTGTQWLLVGPVYTAATGITGAIPATIVDNTGVSRTVIQLYVGASTVGFVSKDAAFTPQTPITGFTTIRPGITLSTGVVSGGSTQVPLFQGTATSALTISGINANAIPDLNTDNSFSGNITIQPPSTLTVNNILNAGTAGTGNIGNASAPFNTFFGTANNASFLGGLPANAYVTSTSGSVSLAANLVGGGVNTVVFQTAANTTGFISAPTTANTALTWNGTSFTWAAAGGVVGNTISVNNILNSGTASTGNIGNATTPFNRIFATSSSSLYADLAERFAADDVYEAGTVVELGGSAEITRAADELSDRVFGVVSTRAAYLMNGAAGSDETHPPVAMTGRVPVKVIGTVVKGDRLVSAGQGIARSAQPGEITAFNVIGRALESKLDTGTGTVEAIVTIK